MQAIRARDTRPEKIVRSLLHRMGYRFRLHRPDLPGKPDIVLPRHRMVILVHGCYWHMHTCRWGRVVPKTNTTFWQSKRHQNVERDRRHVIALEKLDWEVVIVWECETRDSVKLANRLKGRLVKDVE